MDTSLVPQTLGGFLGYVLAALTLLSTWLYNKRKSQVDESTMVLGKWKELVETHEKAIGRAELKLVAAEQKIERLEQRVDELETKLREKDEENARLRIDNRGLIAQIAQHSKSVAQFLPATSRTPTMNKKLENEDGTS